VILVEPGYGALVALQTGQITDLASRGYAVLAMDHPHESFVVEQPNGTLIFSDLAIAPAFQARVRDATAVLDKLRRLVPQANAHTPVLMFGHSLGGAAAAQTMLQDARVIAGVDLDGTLFGRVVTAGLHRPFGVMLARDHTADQDPSLAQFLGHLAGPHPTRTLDVLHNGYTDWVVFNPEAARGDPALGARLEQIAPTGTVQSLHAGRTALARQRAFLARFARRYARAGRAAH
jgi:alpha-beta hydrolase superfamily lysophospholipase